MRVTAAPEAGKANDALLELLADTLELPRRDLELTAGKSTRDKVVALQGLTEDEADSMLAAAVERGR